MNGPAGPFNPDRRGFAGATGQYRHECTLLRSARFAARSAARVALEQPLCRARPRLFHPHESAAAGTAVSGGVQPIGRQPGGADFRGASLTTMVGRFGRQHCAKRCPTPVQRVQRPPVWCVGRATGRWPRRAAGRTGASDRARWRVTRNSAQGLGPDALLPNGRWAGGAALQHPRVFVQRSHPRPGYTHHPCLERGRIRPSGVPRTARNRCCGNASGTQLRPLWPFRAFLPPGTVRSAPRSDHDCPHR